MKKSIFISLMILTCALTGCSKITPISKEITMELGQALSEDPAQFVNVSDEEMLNEIAMDFSGIDFDKAGVYTANAVYEEKRYPIEIHIVDTTPPDVELTANCMISMLNTDVRAEDLFVNIEDKSETSVGIVSVQKTGELEEMSDEDLSAMEKPAAMHDQLTETEFLETVRFTEEGKYLVKAVVKDEAGNLTWFDIPVFADGTGPMISGFEDQSIEYSEIPSGALYDVSKVKAIDAFDGDITETDKTYLEEEIIDSSDNKMSIKVHLYAEDRAGNKTEETFNVNISFNVNHIINNNNYIAASDIKEIKEPYFDRAMAEQAFAKVNEQRVAHGVHALTWDESLYEIACIRAQEIVDKFSHERPDGSYFVDIIIEQYGANGGGENIAANYKSINNLVNAWMNSQGHKENILDYRFNYGVMGCYYYNGSFYWVNLFGA